MIPYGRQCIEEDDVDAVAAVLRSDFLTTGPMVERFEAALCAATGAPYAVVCGNGTEALHLALIGLDFEPGEAAIVPSLTFLATANAVRYAGGEVVFADVNADTGLMGLAELDEAMTRAQWIGLKPKVVLPVHLGGQMVDLKEIEAYGLPVIADASHALGSRYLPSEGEDSLCGACAYETLSTFSFHPVKTIAMGEGGAVTCRDPAIAEKMRRVRCHGMQPRPDTPVYPNQGLDADGQPNPWYYEMVEMGYNYRASDIHCALGVSQLKKLDRFVARRKELAALYDTLLGPLGLEILPPQRVPWCDPALHLYSARIYFEALGVSRAEVMRKLAAQEIGTQVHYIPVHRQPYYRARYKDLFLPGADAYYERTLSLPLFPALKDEDVHRIVEALADAIRKR